MITDARGDIAVRDISSAVGKIGDSLSAGCLLLPILSRRWAW